MKIGTQGAYVEIVAKKKGCMLCDLAIGRTQAGSPFNRHQ
jgi:hypothetical protein